MTSRFSHPRAATLVLGSILLAGAAFLATEPAAAAALKITDKAVGEPLQAAQKAHDARDLRDALDNLRKAEAASKDRATTTVIHQLMLAWALEGNDNATATSTVDKMIAAGEGDRAKNLTTAMALALKSKNTAKAQDYAKQLGGNSAIYIAQAYFQGGDYRQALAVAKPLAGSGTPSQDLLQLLAATYGKLNDEAGRRATQEQLVLHYPKPEYWHDLIRMAHNQKGLTDDQDYELYRLRLATGDMKTADDYSEMAQIGVQLGYPAEAKAVLDKAASLKLLSGPRAQRLIDFVNKQLMTDDAALPKLAQQAAADMTGNTYAKLGGAYYTRAKYKEAEDAFRQALMKGGLKDADMTKIQLGHALSAQGKKQDAAGQFNAVPRSSKDYSVARLWWIYAQRG